MPETRAPASSEGSDPDELEGCGAISGSRTPVSPVPLMATAGETKLVAGAGFEPATSWL